MGSSIGGATATAPPAAPAPAGAPVAAASLPVCGVRERAMRNADNPATTSRPANSPSITPPIAPDVRAGGGVLFRRGGGDAGAEDFGRDSILISGMGGVSQAGNRTGPKS